MPQITSPGVSPSATGILGSHWREDPRARRWSRIPDGLRQRHSAGSRAISLVLPPATSLEHADRRRSRGSGGHGGCEHAKGSPKGELEQVLNAPFISSARRVGSERVGNSVEDMIEGPLADTGDLKPALGSEIERLLREVGGHRLDAIATALRILIDDDPCGRSDGTNRSGRDDRIRGCERHQGRRDRPRGHTPNPPRDGAVRPFESIRARLWGLESRRGHHRR